MLPKFISSLIDLIITHSYCYINVYSMCIFTIKEKMYKLMMINIESYGLLCK